jgi:signal transduction histidine kinase
VAISFPAGPVLGEQIAVAGPNARILRYFCILGGLTSLPWALVWWSWGLRLPGAAIALLALAYAIAYPLIGRVAHRAMPHLLLGATFLLLFVPVLLSGGVTGRYIVWLTIIPLGAGLVLSVREAVGWGIAMLLTTAGLWAVHLWGIGPANQVPPQHQTLVELGTDLSVLLVMLGLGLIAATTQHRARTRVEQSNAELLQTAESLRVQNRFLAALTETGNRLRLEQDLQALLQEICRTICESLGWRYVILSMRDYERGVSYPAAVGGYDDEKRREILAIEPVPIARAASHLQERFRVSRSYFIDHRDGDLHAPVDRTVIPTPQPSRSDAPDAWHPDDMLLVPIELRGRILGVISTDLPASGRKPTLEDLQALELLANVAAVAIDNAQLFQTERETAEILQARSAQLEQAYAELQASQQRLLVSEKMAALGRVTAGIAHEINSPLGGVLNSLQLARELADEYETSVRDPAISLDDHLQIAGELRDTLALAERAAMQVGRFVRTIKDQTRTREDMPGQEFDVADEAQTVLQMLKHPLRHLQLDVVAHVEPGLRIRGDASRFALVLQNLLTNAMDAYHGAPGEVRLSAWRDGERVRVSVQDFGCGIPTEIRDRIFDYLFTTKDVGKGTGLGLSMVHALVTSYFGGEIHVDSEVGAGTTFTASFPALRSIHAEPAHTVSAA